MFTKAECRVKWDSCISKILKSEFGVLQGGILSPKLFTDFLQDISKSFDQGRGISVDTLLIVYLLLDIVPITAQCWHLPVTSYMHAYQKVLNLYLIYSTHYSENIRPNSFPCKSMVGK